MNLYRLLSYYKRDELILLNYKGAFTDVEPKTPKELLKDDFTKRFNVMEIKTEKYRSTTVTIIDII